VAKAEKEAQAQAKAQEILDLKKSNEEAKRVEIDRREQATKFLADLDNLKEEIKTRGERTGPKRLTG
jgi:hypothetical protein